jgi:adenosylcobinamide-GDP ribazoletransferase
MRAFLFAVSFLTRVPLPAWVHEVDDETLARGPLWFPLVGGLIGAVTGLVALGLVEVFSSWVAVLVALAFEARLTGAMHEDALADTCDALGGGWSRERTLEIFKDSRLGTYGVLALVLGIGLRAAASVDLLEAHTALGSGCFVGMMTLAAFSGRLLMLVFLKAMPPLKSRQSLASGFGAGLDWPGITLAGLPLFGLVVWVGDQEAQSMGLALALCALLFGLATRLIRRRLGGSTGDVLGCIAFLGQLVVLVALTSAL